MTNLLPGHVSLTMHSLIKVGLHGLFTTTTHISPPPSTPAYFERKCTYKADTHTHAHSHQWEYISLWSFNNVSKSKTHEASPPVHISPDSRSSELERRSRSNERDVSRSLPLALSTEGDLSLSSKSLNSALSSRHPPGESEHSLSWVWDDLSLEDRQKKKIWH